MRLFVAIDVPDQLKAAIETRVVDPLRERLEGARWTRPDGRHLTLKFLGNVDDAREPEIARVVEGAASRHRRFDAAFSELGGFPNLRRPRVLWLGIGAGNDAMARIAADLESCFVPLGFASEDRAWSGHFTLARFGRPSAIDVPAVDVPDEAFGVTELVLFRSHLHPKGARYEALRSFDLR